MDPKLYEAAASGDINFLRNRNGQPKSDIFLVTKQQQNTVLHIAIKFKQVEFCKEILKSSSSSLLLLVSNSKGESPLHVAAKSGCLEIAQILLKCYSRDVENAPRKEWLRMVDLEKDTALHVAVRNGEFAIAKMLMEADRGLLGLVNNANASPLCLAIEGEFSDIAAFILEKFPQSLDGDHININNALRSAIIHSLHGNYITYSLYMIEVNGLVSLTLICIYVQLMPYIVKLLLERKPNAREEADQIGWTPLHYATLYGDLKSTKLLLQGNSSIAYIADQDGVSALHVAASRGHINVVELLLQCCPDVHEVTDKIGRTLLHVAVMSGQEKMVRHILGMPRLVGIINEKDSEGNTALHLAVIYKRDKIVSLLARNGGIERNVANNKLFTAYDIFSIQPRKLSFAVAKIHYWLRGTRGLPAMQEWINTNLKREMNGEIEMNGTDMFCNDKTDHVSTTSNEDCNNETVNRSRLEIHLLIAMLIATVTFQAAFTLPGGIKEDGPNKGTPQLRQTPAFTAFVVFDSIAFILSIATVFIQFATSKFSYCLRSRYVSLAEMMIFVAILAMLFAFGSCMHVELNNYIGLRLMAYILVACFLLVYYVCWFVDPISMQIPGLERLRKYLRNLLFRYGII